MQNVIGMNFSKLFIFVTGLFLVGCASDPVPTYFPVSHPANPEATEVVYTATPNPFQDGMSMNKMQPAGKPGMSPKAHGNRHSHGMKSDGNKDEQPVRTKTEKTGHHQKEHE